MGTYLVTGAAGFIGRSIAAELLRQGKRVRGIDNLSTGKRENLRGLEAMDFIEADINDSAAVSKACREVECIFHEAAIPSVPRSVEDPVGANHAGVSGTVRLLVAAKDAGVRRVIFAGSSSVYGNAPSLPKSEEMPPSPISPYAVSKLAGEYYLQSFTQVYGLETVTLRYFNVFGPYQDPTSEYSGVLALFTLKMLSGQTPTIFGDGEQSRDFTYIDNVVHANLLAAAAPAEKVSGRTMNMATGGRITLNEAWEMLQKIEGVSLPASYGPSRAGDVRDSQADTTAAVRGLGHSPEVSFEDGLRRTLEWYRKASRAETATGSNS